MELILNRKLDCITLISTGIATFSALEIGGFSGGRSIVGTMADTQLDELSDPGFSSALNQPANGELDKA